MEFQEPSDSDKELVSFVVDHCDRWRDYRDTNYLSDWLEYERIFNGEWDVQDRTRESERSRIVTPATQQAGIAAPRDNRHIFSNGSNRLCIFV